MAWSFPIGTLLGSQLRVHVTFFILLAWIGLAAYAAGGPAAAVENVLFVILLFVCVIAHEFGHALMARRYGVRTPDITLLPIGGVARLERIPEKPSEEIAVAVAGPLVNVVIWLALTLFLGAQTDLGRLLTPDGSTQDFLARLASINLFLVVFNMIPAFPMDGGRVFRALAALWTDRVRATRIASQTGQVIAFLFGFYGLFSGNPFLLLIGVFIFMAAAAENADVSLRDVARRLMARDAMITNFETLEIGDTVRTAGAALIRTTQHEFPVMRPDGSLAGFLTRDAMFSAIAGGNENAGIEHLLVTDVPTVQLTQPLQSALDQLFQKNAPAVAVTDRGGVMLGYITRENIGELMVVSGRGGVR